MEHLGDALIVGIGATLVMDAWGVLRRPLFGLAPLDYALLGRWFGYMTAGRFRHRGIAASPPVRGERLIGWTMHYFIGTAFAGVLLAIWGPTWLERPALGPALLVGVGTVAAPILVMQPAMGNSSSTNRWRARAQAIVTHTAYGLGLYLAGWINHLVIRH